MLQPLNLQALRASYANAKPYPFVKIDNFLDAAAANEIANTFPSFDDALAEGTAFKTTNERKKVQITDSGLFPPPIAELNAALASPGFLSDLSYITGLSNLLSDEKLVGGGIHVTGPGGRLDVHVDFNYLKERQLHRRINLLLYLNMTWDEKWGGHIQLWDKDVRHCEAEFAPAFNRCVIFETSNISFHGVTPVTSTAPMPRQSFATYYYTREAPAHWDGTEHGTIFRARPDERFRKYVAMPVENVQRRIQKGIGEARKLAKHLLR